MSNQTPSPRAAQNAEFVRWLRIVENRSQRLVEAHLRPFGLSVSHGRLFGLVADRSLAGQVTFQRDLEAELLLAASSITHLVQGLERQGLLARRDSATDGRAKELTITDRGWDVRHQLGTHLAQWEAELTAGVSDRELNQLVVLLQKLGGDHNGA